MKTQPKESVVHEWLLDLPFTQQAVLFTAIRGADGISKNDPSKLIVHFVRGIVLKPAYPNFSSDDDYHPDGFMRCDFQNFEPDAQLFWNDHDSVPHHFLMHLIHAIEIIGYNHPSYFIKELFFNFYLHACKSFHMMPETEEQLNNRLKR